MNSLWSIVLPEEDQNLVVNPSAETAITNYDFIGSGTTVTRSSDRARRGVYSVKVVTNTEVNSGMLYDGTGSGTPLILEAGKTYVFAFDFYGPSDHKFKAYFATLAGAQLGSAVFFGGANDWQRWYITYAEVSTASRRLIVSKDDDAAVVTYYVDGMHCSNKAYEVTYVDGEQPGCTWDGTEHFSKSTRLGGMRTGGRIYNLGDSGLNLAVMAVVGAGTPSSKHNVQNLAFLPGASFGGRKVLPRVTSFKILAPGTSLVNLRSLRKALINATKPDAAPGDQPFLMQYQALGWVRPVRFSVVYDTGLEGSGLEGFNDEIDMRVIGYDPLVYEDGDGGAVLLSSKDVGNANMIIGRVSGDWTNLSTGFTGGGDVVRVLAVGPDGKLYIGGSFTTAGGQFVGNLALWTGSTYTFLGTFGTGANGQVRALVHDAKGNMYVGGDFTTINSTSANRVAKWDGTIFTALGTGITTSVLALAIGKDGELYAGFSGTTAGGITANYVAKWGGSAWSTLGTGLSAPANHLVVDSLGNLFVGGSFTTAGGLTVNNIAKWNGTSWSAMGTGVSGPVYALEVGPDDSIYAGGAFTTAGNNTVNNIAKWNGVSWTPLGSGVNDSVYSIRRITNDVLLVGGVFTSASGLSITDRVAYWNGTTWAHTEVNFPGSPTIYDAIAKKNGDLYIAFTTTGTAGTAYLNTVTNPGSSSRGPKIRFKRSGGSVEAVPTTIVKYLRNETTGKTVWLNHSLHDGETLELDFGRTLRVTSSFKGPIGRSVLRGSDFATFTLIPGTNKLSVYVQKVSGGPTVDVVEFHPITHWGIDGAAA